MVSVPADAHLDGQRGILPDRPARGGDHPAAEFGVKQQLAACPARGNLGGRAAHIQIKNIKGNALFPHDCNGLFEGFRLGADQLNCINAVRMLVPQKRQAFFIAERDGLGGGHLAHRPRCAVIRHQVTAGRIGQPRHGGKDRRDVRQGQIS